MDNDINYMRKELDRVQIRMSDFLRSVKTEYAQSTSDTTPPTTGWSETKPSPKKGKFIWVRHIMNMGYGDVITEPVCLGEGFENITELDVEYISWADPYQAPPQDDTGWQTKTPSLTEGHYIWARTKIVTTEQTTYTDPVRITGETSEEMAMGNGYLTGNGNYIHIVYSDVNDPQSWNQCFRYPSNHNYVGVLVNNSDDYVTTPSSYTWMAYNGDTGYNVGDGKYFHVKYSNNSTGYDADHNVDMNDKGGLFFGYCTDTNQADPSTPSSYTWIRLEGKGLLDITEYYAESTRYTTPPTSGWSSTPLTFREGYFYWTKSIINYTDGTSVETTPICVSGVDGSNIHYVYYCSNSTTPPSTPTWNDIIEHPTESEKYDHWVEDPVPVKSDKRYLYISSATTKYVDGEKGWSVFSSPSLWARYAMDGNDGGTFDFVYYTKNNNTTPSINDSITPSSTPTQNTWCDKPYQVSDTYKYCFISYRQKKDGEWVGSYSTPVLWAKYGEQGQQGIQGEKGDDGEGLEMIFFRSTTELTNWGTSRFIDSGVTGSANTSYYVTRATKTVGSDGTTLTATSNSGLAIFQSVSTEFNLNITIEFDLLSSCSSAKIQIYESSTTTEQYINISKSGHYVINIASNTIYGTCDGVPIDVPSTYPSTKARLGFAILTSGQSIKFKNLKVYDTWGYRNPHVWRVQPDTSDYFIKESGWTDDSQGVDETNIYEYMCMRTKTINSNGEGKWGIFNTPSLWSKYGERGKDGESIDPSELVARTTEELNLDNINAVTLNNNTSDAFIKSNPDFVLKQQEGSSGRIECYKLGLLVIISVKDWMVYNRGSGNYVPFCKNTTTSTDLIYVPEGYRPSTELYIPCATRSGNSNAMFVYLNTVGELYTNRNGYVSTSVYAEVISCSFVFFEDTRTDTNITLSSVNNMYVGDKITATLTSGNNPLTGKVVIFNINNVNYSRTTDGNGQAELSLNIPGATSYNCRVSFNGDTTYKSSTQATGYFTLQKATASITIFGSQVHRNEFVKGQVLNNHNNPLKGLIIKMVMNGDTFQCGTLSDGSFECPHPNDKMKYDNTVQRFNILIESNNYCGAINQAFDRTFN